MRLEADETVDDVHARLLELAGPLDVVLLVEPRLDLDEREHGLARFGRMDERLDDRAIAARAIQRLLDGQHVRVAGSLLEKRLHARRERLVGVVNEHVFTRDRAEDVRGRARLDGLQLRGRHGHVLRILQAGPVELADLEETPEVERRRQSIDLLLGDAELAHQQAESQVIHVVGDLEPDGRAEAPSQQLAFERLDEVLGLVFFDFDVFVARDAELVVLENLHAGEQLVEMIADEVFEGEEPHAAAAVIGQLHEPGQYLRHLQAGELDLLGLGVTHAHREIERQARDVRKGVGRVDRERHEHREDLLGEDLVDTGAVGFAQVGPRFDVDARLVERGLDQIVEHGDVTALQLEGERVDVGEHVARRAPGVRRHGEAGHDAALQAGDPHHEELVEIAREDGQEVDTFEQRHRLVFGELEHPLVEAQPAELAVEIPLDGQRAVVDARRLVVVVDEIAADAAVDLVPRVGESIVVHGAIVSAISLGLTVVAARSPPVHETRVHWLRERWRTRGAATRGRRR